MKPGEDSTRYNFFRLYEEHTWEDEISSYKAGAGVQCDIYSRDLVKETCSIINTQMPNGGNRQHPDGETSCAIVIKPHTDDKYGVVYDWPGCQHRAFVVKTSKTDDIDYRPSHSYATSGNSYFDYSQLIEKGWKENTVASVSLPVTHALEIYSEKRFDSHAYTYTTRSNLERKCVDVYENPFTHGIDYPAQLPYVGEPFRSDTKVHSFVYRERRYPY